jgi:hypothetical protein
LGGTISSMHLLLIMAAVAVVDASLSGARVVRYPVSLSRL